MDISDHALLRIRQRVGPMGGPEREEFLKTAWAAGREATSEEVAGFGGLRKLPHLRYRITVRRGVKYLMARGISDRFVTIIAEIK